MGKLGSLSSAGDANIVVPPEMLLTTNVPTASGTMPEKLLTATGGQIGL